MAEKIERNGYTLDWLGGYCPVQAEGTIDGLPLYFRARGGQWSLDIGVTFGAEPPLFWYQEEWGTWPDAGYMADDVALEMIDKAVALYREAKPEKIERHDPRWGHHVLQAWSDERISTQAAINCLGTNEEALEQLAADEGLPLNSYYEITKKAEARRQQRKAEFEALGLPDDPGEREKQNLKLWGRGTISLDKSAEYLYLEPEKIPARAMLYGYPPPNAERAESPPRD